MDHELDLEQKYLELVRQFMEESEQIRLKELSAWNSRWKRFISKAAGRSPRNMN